MGDGPERNGAEKYCREHNLCDNVMFIGKQDNLPELFGCTDVLLLPSETESFGLVALEAMSCEVPVVATRVGGLPEVVMHGETGFLADLGDVQSMADYALRIVDDPALKAEMGRNGRRRAVECFDQRNIVPHYEKFYSEVLGR